MKYSNFYNALFRKLRCPRNTLHMHLFVSFMLRAFMALLKDSLFIDGIGLPQTIGNGKFLQEQAVSTLTIREARLAL
jgi:hypothetical protein